jgi:transcriptional regulator with XRE-family HTH domain
LTFRFQFGNVTGMAHPLTKFREQENLSQAELARLLGETRPNVNRWEAGSRNIPLGKVHSVSQKTGIPAKELRPDLIEEFEKLLGGAQ